nr:serine/arginine repetitive matrix protein 1-like [Cavia porcellus]
MAARFNGTRHRSGFSRRVPRRRHLLAARTLASAAAPAHRPRLGVSGRATFQLRLAPGGRRQSRGAVSRSGRRGSAGRRGAADGAGSLRVGAFIRFPPRTRARCGRRRGGAASRLTAGKKTGPAAEPPSPSPLQARPTDQSAGRIKWRPTWGSTWHEGYQRGTAHGSKSPAGMTVLGLRPCDPCRRPPYVSPESRWCNRSKLYGPSLDF